MVAISNDVRGPQQHHTHTVTSFYRAHHILEAMLLWEKSVQNIVTQDTQDRGMTLLVHPVLKKNNPFTY